MRGRAGSLFVAFSLASVSWFCVTGIGNAQILSNLQDFSNSYELVSDGYWVAQPFTTGSNATGYSLSSVSLNFSSELSPTNPVTLSIYSSSGGGVGSEVTNGRLSGTAVPQTAIDTWTPTADEPVILAPSTEYWIVAATLEPNPQPYPAIDPFYSWAFVRVGSASTSPNSWTIPAGYDLSLDQGASWQSATAETLFSINATDAVPEPESWKLTGVVLTIMVLMRLRRRFGTRAYSRHISSKS